MVEIFTVGGGDYLVNVFQAVAAWTGNGGYKSLLQVVMVMGLALSALTAASDRVSASSSNMKFIRSWRRSREGSKPSA